MSKTEQIRINVLGNPKPNFSGELITEKDVAQVFMWCENQNRSLSPSKILESVTTLLREHVENQEKSVQTQKQVRTKVFRIIEKVKNLDRFTRVLENPTKWVPIKKISVAASRRIFLLPREIFPLPALTRSW